MTEKYGIVKGRSYLSLGLAENILTAGFWKKSRKTEEDATQVLAVETPLRCRRPKKPNSESKKLPMSDIIPRAYCV